MDFNQLLRESRRLESQMEGAGISAMRARPNAGGGIGAAQAQPHGAVGIQSLRVPPLTRSLAQLDVASSKLLRMAGTTGTPLSAAADSQAQLLLAAKGIDVRKQARALKELQQAQPARGASGVAAAAAGPMPIEHFHPLDIESFLQQQQQMLCHSAMEEAGRVTSDTYRRHDLNSLDEDWELSKRNILDGLGFRAGQNAIAAAGGVQQQMQMQEEAKRKAGAMSAGSSSYDQQQAPTAVGPVLGMEQAIYARTVQELNRARVRRTPVPLIGMLKTAAANVDEFFQRQQVQGGDLGGHQTMSANGLSVGDVTDCWDVLRCMLQSAEGGDEYAQQLQPRAELLVEQGFAAAYAASPNSPDGARFRTQLIEGAKAYSQGLFEAYLRRVVAAHPEARRGQQQQQQAQGGRPSFARQAASYVAVLSDKLPQACREFQFEGLPFWPQVYYCFRCGYTGEALQLLHQALEQSHGGAGGLGGLGGRLGGASGSSPYEQLTRVFVDCMEQRVVKDRALSPALWVQLHDEYQRELSMGVNSARAHGAPAAQAGQYLDPFKLALYHLLGRFRLPQPQLLDLSALVAPTTEDYLWLKLSLLHEGGSGLDALQVPDSLREHVDSAALRLASMQAELLSRGEAAFNPDGRHPLAYFKVLLLSQQFEQAVYFLIKTAHFTVGVHFAVALHYAGCMHTHANSKQELLVALSSGGAGSASNQVGAVYALNYSRILRKYVESFVRSHPFEAFHYLYLLHSHSGGAASSKASASRFKGLGASNASFGLLHSASVEGGMDDAAAGSIDGDSAFLASDASFAAIRDLLLETREYDLLVGSIVPSSASASAAAATSFAAAAASADSIQTSRGLLYHYFSRSEAQSLLVATGSTMESHGLTLDAIQLYLLAYRFDLAVELALKSLAPLLASPVQQGERQSVVESAQRVQRVVRNQQEAGQMDATASRGGAHHGDASSSSLRGLHVLLRLVNFFDLYHLGPAKYEDALCVLGEPGLALVPFDPAQVAEASSAFLNESQTHRQVQRVMGAVSVALMDVYYVQYQMARREMASQSMYQAQQMQRDQGKQARLTALRQQARALLTFLGHIRSSMQIDADIDAKLVSIEALMAP